MKHGLALIISQTTSSSAKMMEHLQRADWDAAAAAPESALASALQLQPSAAVICGCDTDALHQTLEAFKLNRPTAGLPIILRGTAPIDESAVRIQPDLLIDSESAIAALLSSNPRMTDGCQVAFRVPNNFVQIDALTSLLNRLYEQFGLDAELKHRLTTAVREMTHNAIEWGNRGVADASVRVHCQIKSGSLTLRVRDCGQGFDRKALPHAATSQDPTRHLNVRDSLGLRAGGFGILMTRGLVDELSYNEAGNEVCIVKRL